jgi:hypothetical protein
MHKVTFIIRRTVEATCVVILFSWFVITQVYAPLQLTFISYSLIVGIFGLLLLWRMGAKEMLVPLLFTWTVAIQILVFFVVEAYLFSPIGTTIERIVGSQVVLVLLSALASVWQSFFSVRRRH